MIHHRTKIVATLGPASDTPEMITRLVRAGVNVFRINAAHCEPRVIRTLIHRIRRVDRELKAGIGVLVDLQGPKIRVGSFVRAEPIWLQAGRELIITTEPGVLGAKAAAGEVTRIGTRYEGLSKDVRPKEQILLDDGNIELRVIEVVGTEIRTKVVFGGLLKQHKGINLPGSTVSTDCLTEEDLKDLAVALEEGADYVALSFVRSDQDIIRLREYVEKSEFEVGIIAKIERPEAVRNLNGIVEVSDGLMVARGDLGVEMGAEFVPALQKKIIRLANEHKKPVITATQMLESMIVNPRPTRAEASDVANAIYDHTSAVMLSAETASGKYPVESVKFMGRIIREAERDSVSGWELPRRRAGKKDVGVTSATVRAAVYAAFEVGGQAIAVFSESGATAQAIAAERPPTSVIVFTPFQRTVQRLALVWGVSAFRAVRTRTSHEMTLEGDRILFERGLVKPGQYFVVVVGSSRQQGLTNIMHIRTMADLDADKSGGTGKAAATATKAGIAGSKGGGAGSKPSSKSREKAPIKPSSPKTKATGRQARASQGRSAASGNS
jgi:pyruvate kinase